MAHDVFISYSTENKAIADAVCAGLEARGIRCWIAPRDGTPGIDYAESINDALEQTKTLALVFSAHANKSKHVSNEVQLAFKHGKTIIPFRIEEVAPSKSLEYFIGSIHWLDALTPPLAGHIETLADNIERKLRSSVDAAPSVRPVHDIVPVRSKAPARPNNVFVQFHYAIFLGLVFIVVAILSLQLAFSGNRFGRHNGVGAVPGNSPPSGTEAPSAPQSGGTAPSIPKSGSEAPIAPPSGTKAP